jgi:hypothetical protein
MTSVAFEVDWRGLFSHIKVDWRDTGRNTSRNNVNINCPMCKDDRGFHMAVSTRIEAYSCWRAPKHHAGRNFQNLLYMLGCSRDEAVRLLNRYRISQGGEVTRAAVAPGDAEWAQFPSCTNSDYYLQYIRSRLFDDPMRVAAAYDLRYSPAGRWADRLLMPVRWDGAFTTWIGRATRPDLEPRYNNRPCNDEGYLYFPRAPRKHLIIVEGPIDALKLCVALAEYDVSAVALCNKNLNVSKVMKLQETGSTYMHLMLDSDSALLDSFQMIRVLARAMPSLYIARFRLPAGFKDAGALTEQQSREHWMSYANTVGGCV